MTPAQQALIPLTTPQPGGPNPNATATQPIVINGQTLVVNANGVLPQFRSIPRYNYFDLSLRQSVAEHLDLSLTVNNLFDKQAPLVGNGVGGTAFNNGNTFPTVYDPIGRYFTIGARMKF